MQVAVDDEIDEIIEVIKEKFPIGNCQIHPKDHCFSKPGGTDHWLLDRPKLVTWAGTIASSLCPLSFL